MFCPNCGTQVDDGAVFCGNCGTKIGRNNNTYTTGNAGIYTGGNTVPNYGSDIAIKRQKTIKILSIISLIIQSIMCGIAFLFMNLLTLAVFNWDNVVNRYGAASATIAVMIIILVLLFFAYFFTIKGVKKKSTGFLIGSAIFSFLATFIGARFIVGGMPNNLIVACIILATHIVMIVLNIKNRKEYPYFCA